MKKKILSYKKLRRAFKIQKYKNFILILKNKFSGYESIILEKKTKIIEIEKKPFPVYLRPDLFSYISLTHFKKSQEENSANFFSFPTFK